MLYAIGNNLNSILCFVNILSFRQQSSSNSVYFKIDLKLNFDNIILFLLFLSYNKIVFSLVSIIVVQAL